MGILNLILLAAGIALVAVGWTRTRGPWRRYQALQEQQSNVARYEAWRGGIRPAPDERTGASVMLAALRRQAQIGGAIVIAGAVLVFLGFFLR